MCVRVREREIYMYVCVYECWGEGVDMLFTTYSGERERLLYQTRAYACSFCFFQPVSLTISFSLTPFLLLSHSLSHSLYFASSPLRTSTTAMCFALIPSISYSSSALLTSYMFLSVVPSSNLALPNDPPFGIHFSVLSHPNSS